TDAVRYRDTVLPPGVTAMLRLTPSGIETLRYDADGDGIFETLVQPTVSLTGSPAGDITPPAITISGEAQQTRVRITINAQDGESGVRDVYYSLDRTNYQLY